MPVCILFALKVQRYEQEGEGMDIFDFYLDEELDDVFEELWKEMNDEEKEDK